MGNSTSTVSPLENDENIGSQLNTQRNITSTGSTGHLPNLKHFMVTVYSILSLAILFNFRVIYIVLRALIHSRRTTTPTRQGTGGNQHAFVYVLSLSIVDSFVLAHLPFVATDIELGWIFGTIVCKLYWIIEQVNRILSTFILTALSGDRYLAVCHPFNQKLRRFRTTTGAICVISIIVFVAGTLLIPTYVFSRIVLYPGPENRSIPKCAFDMDNLDHMPFMELDNISNFNLTNSNFSQFQSRSISMNSVFLIYIFVCGYGIPLASMVFFYTGILTKLWRKNTTNNANSTIAVAESTGARRYRGQKRAQHVTQRVLVLVLFYFGCWTPYWAVQFYIEFIFDPNKPRTEQDAPLFVTILVAHLLTYLNSAVNPFLYALLNKELQSHGTSGGGSSVCLTTHSQRQQSNISRTNNNQQRQMSDECTALMVKSTNRAIRSVDKSPHLFSQCFPNRRGSVGQDPNEIPLLTQKCDTHRNSRIQNATRVENGGEN